MSHRSALLALAGCLIAGASLAAQQTAKPTADSVRADSTAAPTRPTRELERVRVTAPRTAGYVARSTRAATRTDTPLRDVPQAATVLTRQVIADQALQSLADGVRYVRRRTTGL